MVVHRWEPLPLASSISYHASSSVWLVLSPLYLKVWCLGSLRTNPVYPFIVLELEPRLGGFCIFREVFWLLLLFILIASSGWFPSDSFEVFAIFWVFYVSRSRFSGSIVPPLLDCGSPPVFHWSVDFPVSSGRDLPERLLVKVSMKSPLS